MKNKNIPERIVLEQCLQFLKLKGFFCWRNNTGALKSGSRFIRFGFPGSADILGILPNGRFLAVECKRSKGGILSEKQKEFQKAITENNGIYILANDVNVLIQYFRKQKYDFSFEIT